MLGRVAQYILCWKVGWMGRVSDLYGYVFSQEEMGAKGGGGDSRCCGRDGRTRSLKSGSVGKVWKLRRFLEEGNVDEVFGRRWWSWGRG